MTFPFYPFSSRHPPRERRADANGNGGGTARVVRGASWNNNTEINLRSSYRNNDHPTERNDNNGFRLVVVVGGVGGKASGPTWELG